MIVPMLNLSQAVPAGPIVAIRSMDSAEPSWTERIAAMAKAHGGTIPFKNDGFLQNTPDCQTS